MRVLIVDGLLFINDPMNEDVEFNKEAIKKVADIIKGEDKEIYILFPLFNFEPVEGYLKEMFISLGVTDLSMIKFYSTFEEGFEFKESMRLTFLRFLMNEWDKIEYYQCIGRKDIDYHTVPADRIRALDITY